MIYQLLRYAEIPYWNVDLSIFPYVSVNFSFIDFEVVLL